MKSILFCASLLLAVHSAEHAHEQSEASHSTNEKRENFIANANSDAKAVATQDSDGAYLGNGLGGDDDAIHGSYGCEELQDVSVEVYVAHGQVEITMKGPQGEWFGFGFGSYRMEGTYAIIAGEDCVSDYILSKATTKGDQSDNKIDDAVSPITVISDESDGFYRTIRIQRPRDHPDTFSFPSNIGNYPIISAKAAYQTHRVAYHGNNRRPDRIQFNRVYQHIETSTDAPADSSSEETGYSTNEPKITASPTTTTTTTSTTTKAPTTKPTTRPTTAWPTEKPTSKPTYKPTSKPTTLWPTPKPTSAECCVPAPGQGSSGYQHAARNHENPLKCTDVTEQDGCERLMNSRGEFRCDWASGSEFCAYQENEAQLRDAAAHAEYVEEQRQKQLKEKKEREDYEKAQMENAKKLAEESRRTEEIKEADRVKHFAALENAAKMEAEQFAKAAKAIEAAEEAMKAAKKAAKELAKKEKESGKAKESVKSEMAAWDGPSGECVWNGMKLGALKAEAMSLDAECAVLAEMSCLEREADCAWVGFQHIGAHREGVNAQESEMAVMNVKALMAMKVSTMDILLGAAVVITAAFALHQMCRYLGARSHSGKGAMRFEETPLLNTV